MKIKTILTLLLISLIGCNQNSQTSYKKDSIDSVKSSYDNASVISIIEDSIFHIFEPQELKSFQYNGFLSHHECKIDGHTFLFGVYEDSGTAEKSKKHVGAQMIVLDKSNSIIFSSQGAGDSRDFFPTFYKLNNSSPIFILIDLGDECGAWGQAVYKMDNSGVDSVGYLDVASIPEDINADYYSYGIDVSIRKSIDGYFFEFMKDTMFLNPGGINQKVVKCRDVRYRYCNSKFVLLQK